MIGGNLAKNLKLFQLSVFLLKKLRVKKRIIFCSLFVFAETFCLVVIKNVNESFLDVLSLEKTVIITKTIKSVPHVKNEHSRHNSSPNDARNASQYTERESVYFLGIASSGRYNDLTDLFR